MDLEEMAQKAKARWAVEGDENSKYFHGILNNKRSHLAIRGVLVNGDWIVKPNDVKNKFLNHFSSQFDRLISHRICLDDVFNNQLSLEQQDDLERTVSIKEIKRAVWDCDTNKSPGPDGTLPKGCNSSFIALIQKTQNAKTVKDFRPISLIGSLYKIIAKILANRLSFVIPDLISDVQLAFISNRQILDGPFILNELLSWCKYKKLKAMVFKVDFETAFDLIRGLKQGDPLSPFLFILIMESLHLSFKKVKNAGLFTGIPLDNSLTISHLFYVDDAIFVGKWDSSNLKIILRVLKCFYMASEIKININMSKLMGYGVHSDEVEIAARYIGCGTFVSPFSHLGVKTRTIKAILGEKGNLEAHGNITRRSPWLDIVREINVLRSKGVDFLSLIRKKVGNVKSASHLFFTCHVARLIWKKVLRWWDLDENMIDSYDDWLLLLKNIRLPKRLKDLFEGVCYVKWWIIWRIRNQVLFGDKHPPRDTLFDDLLTISFQWCSNHYNSKHNQIMDVYVEYDKSVVDPSLNVDEAGPSNVLRHENDVGVDEGNYDEAENEDIGDGEDYEADNGSESEEGEAEDEGQNKEEDEDLGKRDEDDEGQNKEEDEDLGKREEEDEGDEDDEHIDDIVDEEHIVDELEVKMNGFKFTVEGENEDPMQPKLNMNEIDLEVLDFDSFESDIDDKEEGFRRKGLRKLRKEAANSTSTTNFYVRKEFPNRDVAKEMDAFRASGRELLGFDGAFMKGQYSRQLLTVVGVDTNNGIYRVAYGTVESESSYSWTWFLTCLCDNLELFTNSNFTFILDRQKRFCMENSKRESIPMQEKLKLSKSQGASTPAELKRIQNVPYASAVGFIMYAVRSTRPDVAFAQNVSCYTDAGYLTDADDLKSQTGYVFVLNGGAVDWKIAKQSIFATSSAEAEYIDAFDASKMILDYIWYI
nr:putative RNA-directed DNA polymerase, eukaryota, reverse transcriptase zinc-binding domain protein [Tanacetum cinerariifolium]